MLTCPTPRKISVAVLAMPMAAAIFFHHSHTTQHHTTRRTQRARARTHTLQSLTLDVSGGGGGRRFPAVRVRPKGHRGYVEPVDVHIDLHLDNLGGGVSVTSAASMPNHTASVLPSKTPAITHTDVKSPIKGVSQIKFLYSHTVSDDQNPLFRTFHAES